MSILQGLQVIPSILQAITGGTQTAGEAGTNLLNIARQEGGAEEIRRVTEDAGQRFQDLVIPRLQEAEGRFSNVEGNINQTLDQVSETLRTGRDEALERFRGITDFVQGRGRQIEDRFSERTDQLRAGLQDFTNRTDATGQQLVSRARQQGEENVDEVQAQGQAHIESQIAQNTQFLEELRSGFDTLFDNISTNIAERAGGEVGGIRLASQRRAEEFAVRERANGILSEAEIASEVDRIRAEGDRAASEVWSRATTAVNDRMVQVGTVSGQVQGSVMQTMTNATTGLRTAALSNVTNAIIESGRLSERAGEFAAGLSTEARQFSLGTQSARDEAEAELSGGVMNAITGSMEFVSSQTSQIIAGEASAQAANSANRNQYAFAVAQNLSTIDQLQATAMDRLNDIYLNGGREAVAVALGQTFQFPNVTALMAPANQMMQNASTNILSHDASTQEQKGSASFSFLGIGGGGSCIDGYCHVVAKRAESDSQGEYTYIKDVRIGHFVRGTDGNFHEVLIKDYGSVDEADRRPYVYVLTYSGCNVIVSDDHIIGGKRADELRPDDPLEVMVHHYVPKTHPDGTFRDASEHYRMDDRVLSVRMVPYRPGGDLLLRGQTEYEVGGIIVDSMIARMTPEQQAQIRADEIRKHIDYYREHGYV